MTFIDLTAEQQDHLFYALDTARLAVSDYYLIELGEAVPVDFERVLAQEYLEQLVAGQSCMSVQAAGR